MCGTDVNYEKRADVLNVRRENFVQPGISTDTVVRVFPKFYTRPIETSGPVEDFDNQVRTWSGVIGPLKMQGNVFWTCARLAVVGAAPSCQQMSLLN